SLSKLRVLELNGNQLVGHVPKELGNLENLQQLRIQNNNLTGTSGTTRVCLSVRDSHVFTVGESCIYTFNRFRAHRSLSFGGTDQAVGKYHCSRVGGLLSLERV
ncbi:unnamed protein product, partial [Ectocarpus sp. 12 AP-2014]